MERSLRTVRQILRELRSTVLLLATYFGGALVAYIILLYLRRSWAMEWLPDKEMETVAIFLGGFPVLLFAGWVSWSRGRRRYRVMQQRMLLVMPQLPAPTPQAAQQLDIWLVGHTTGDISQSRYVASLFESLKRLSPQDRVRAVWEDYADGAVRSRSYNELGAGDIDTLFASGTFWLRAESGDWEAGIVWHRIHHRERGDYFMHVGRQQNKVWLRTTAGYLDSAARREELVSVCKDVSLLADVNYLYCYRRTEWEARSDAAVELRDGLRAIHWVDVFGPPYIDMIGREKLLGCPAFQVAELSDTHILIRATEVPGPVGDREYDAQQRSIRKYIGPRYFTKTNAASPTEEVRRRQQAGFWEQHFRPRGWSMKTPGEADIHPIFHWAEILLDD